MPLEVNILIYVFVFVLGAVIGSFLNVLIYRIPLKLDFVRGSSFCPKCEHRLGALDLIPIVSYLALGRKCRYCKEPISARYMIIELVAALLAIATWTAFNFPSDTPLLQANSALIGTSAPILAAILYFLVLCILLVITAIDAETMEIPDGLNIALAVCALLALFVAPEVSIVSRLIGLVCVSAPFFAIAIIVAGAFGGGDIKLMAAAGLLLGWQNVLVAAFVGIIIGGVYGIFLLISGKKGAKGHFAFGPALCAGIALALFFGKQLIGWYLGFF